MRGRRNKFKEKAEAKKGIFKDLRHMTGSLLARRSTKSSMAEPSVEQGLGCSSVVDHRGPGSIPSTAHRHRGRL